MIKSFRNGQRIKIVEHGSFEDLNGRVGTVCRLLISTPDVAWVAMDETLPPNRSPFPADDPYGRGQHLKIYRDECESV